MNEYADNGAGIDYPTAWKIAARVAPEYHHNRCSYNVTSGGMLCDCDVLTKSPEYLAAYVFPLGSGDPLECPPDGGCGGCGNWPEHCACPIPPGRGER